MGTSQSRAAGAGRAASRSLFLPVCLVAFSAVSAALALSFYFRGELGDYRLHNITAPSARMNEYWPAHASQSLIFPRLLAFLTCSGAVVGSVWLFVSRGIARRERCSLKIGLSRSAAVFYPLMALLLVPAHWSLGWPMTIGPVFLFIFCIGLCAAVAGYLVRPRVDGRVATAVFSVWGVAALAAVYAAVFCVLILRQYYGLHLAYVDSGLFAEGLDHAARGGALRTNWTLWDDSGLVFSWHCVFILAPLSYLYRLWPAHEMLLVLQTVALASGGVAVYLIGRSVVRHRFASWALAVAWLAAPTTAYVNLPLWYGFRPMSLLGPLTLWAIVFLVRRRLPAYFLFVVLVLMTKETSAPVVTMLGVFIALRYRWWGVSALTVALGVGYFLLTTKVVVPYMLGRPYVVSGLLSRFGSSAGEIVANVARDPWAAIDFMFGVRTKVFFLLHLIVPLMLLPMFSPSAALVAAASFTILVMASYYSKFIILAGAQSPVLAGLYLAAAYGLKNVSERRGFVLRRLLPRRVFGDRARILVAAGLGIAVASVATHYFFFLHTMTWNSHVVGPRARRLAELRRLTRRTGSLCASPCLAAHFTDQEELFVTPFGTTTADTVVLDLRERFSGLQAMAAHRAATVRSGRYGAVYAREGFVIFQRGAAGGAVETSYRLDGVPAPRYRVNRALRGFATLLGYDARQGEDGAQFTLYWRCEKRTELDWAVTLVVAASQEGRVHNMGLRYLPAGGVLPTWQWEPGEIIVDPFLARGLSLANGRGEPIVEVALEPLAPAESGGRVIERRP